MTKHTPGPWEALFNGHYWQFGDSESFQIGDVCASQYDGEHTKENPNYDLAKANAHLIAAAPDLLEALKEMTELCLHTNAKAFHNGVTDATGSIDEGDHRASCIIDAALAAIAKAEGL